MVIEPFIGLAILWAACDLSVLPAGWLSLAYPQTLPTIGDYAAFYAYLFNIKSSLVIPMDTGTSFTLVALAPQRNGSICHLLSRVVSSN